MTNVGLIGIGTIGSEVYQRLTNLGINVPYIIEYDGIYRGFRQKKNNRLVADSKISDNTPGNYTRFLEKVDAIMLCIPTFDTGETAYGFIKSAVEKNKPIVTSEKGALSNYFVELKDYLNQIGYSATVGGGSRLLRYMQERMNENVTEVHGVVNGTLNFIFDEVSNGRPIAEAVDRAKQLGYTEPGAETLLEIVNKEANSDVPMKASILFNLFSHYSGLNTFVRATEIDSKSLDKKAVQKLRHQAKNRRYIVSITKNGNNNDQIGGFKHKSGEWEISAGFKHINENPLFEQVVPRGVNNSLLLYEGEYGEYGIYSVKGPGAGPKPTANSMIIDLLQLIKKS